MVSWLRVITSLRTQTYFRLSLGYVITILIRKITNSSIVIGLKSSIFHLFTCKVVIGQLVFGQFVIGQFVIGQFVIGQFNIYKPIIFKVVV